MSGTEQKEDVEVITVKKKRDDKNANKTAGGIRQRKKEEPTEKRIAVNIK